MRQIVLTVKYSQSYPNHHTENFLFFHGFSHVLTQGWKWSWSRSRSQNKEKVEPKLNYFGSATLLNGGRIIDNLQIDNLKIDNRQIDKKKSTT